MKCKKCKREMVNNKYSSYCLKCGSEYYINYPMKVIMGIFGILTLTYIFIGYTFARLHYELKGIYKTMIKGDWIEM